MAINTEKAKIIGIYGVVHAIVDFASAFTVYYLSGKIETLELLQIIILYNVLAFGLQSVFGAVTDRVGKPQNFSIIGCLLLIAGLFLLKKPFLAITLCGLGNALFHTGGGVISLKMGNGRAKLAGLFVAPGAVGLFLGAFLALKTSLLLPVFLLLISVGFLMFNEPVLEEQKVLVKRTDFSAFMLIIICILISVCIRSFIGLSYDFTGKGDITLMFIMVFAVALGKASGGFLSDKFGMYNVAVIGLLLSIPLLRYGYHPCLAILGMFCFNLTMPITVTALANMLPKYKGFAFGLTTLCLLAGFLPVIADYKIPQSMMFFEVIILSVLVTALALKMYDRLFDRP